MYVYRFLFIIFLITIHLRHLALVVIGLRDLDMLVSNIFVLYILRNLHHGHVLFAVRTMNRRVKS